MDYGVLKRIRHMYNYFEKYMERGRIDGAITRTEEGKRRRFQECSAVNRVRGCKYNHHIYELGGGTLKSTKTEGEAGTTRSHICIDVMHEACTYMLDRAEIRRNRMCRTLISASYSCFPIPSCL